MVSMNYEIAIIGGGNAGLSLAKQLIEKNLSNNIIIIEPIEAIEKKANWCSWQENRAIDLSDDSIKGLWDEWRIIDSQSYVHHRSSKYKYICRDAATYLNNIETYLQNNGVRILRDKAVNVSKNNNNKIILCNSETIHACHIYDSRAPEIDDTALKQHFVGIEYELEKDVLIDKYATLMDFTGSQEAGLHFIYALPLSASRVFVESTVISKQLNASAWYEDQITGWLECRGMKTNQILSRESGVIAQEQIRITNQITHRIGAGGGATRLATGYAFHNIIRQIDLLIKNIESGDYDVPLVMSNFTINMDLLFNKVLINNPSLSIGIFTQTAKALTGDQFSEFMLNQANINIWYKVIKNMPKSPFLKELTKVIGVRW